MDSKPTATETTTIRNLVVPEIQRSLRIPQEIIDEILDHLVADTDCDALYQDKSLSKLIRSCSLVSKLWVTPCQRHLFHTIDFNVEGMDKWIKAFRVPYRSPARYIRDLRLSVSGYLLPTEFLRRMQSFTNVKRISVLGNEPRIRFFRIPSFVGLPQSATSFSIEAKIVDLEQIRDVMKLLPNLDDLSLSGSIDVGPRASLRGLGAVLQARFGGRLRLRVLEGTDKYFVDMLLEVPTGLRFTEVDAYARPESHLSIVRLVEACSGTLVKLSYGCFTTTGVFDQSFDFSKFSSVQEVSFVNIRWRGGDLEWIPAALTTLDPATSPRLSKIYLEFTGPTQLSFLAFVPETSYNKFKNNLLRIADELTRIKREFRGTVNLIVSRAAGFELFDTHKVLQPWVN